MSDGSTGSSGVGAMAAKLGWWRRARLGMFVHWGPCAISQGELSWSRAKSNPRSPNAGSTPVEVYDNLYKRFDPVKFDAREWASVAKRMGAGYLVLTARHHDGFCLWDTKTTDYCITNTPFKRDVVRELSEACRAEGIRFCTYYSPADWRDMDCRHPEHNGRFVEKMHAQITELMTNYGENPLMWFDFDGYPNPSDPRETAELVRKLNPGVIMTNRLEPLQSDESHGLVGPWGDYATPEQFVGGYCDTVPWETCMTLGTQWGWKANDHLKGAPQAVATLLGTLGGDGNLLLNLAPNDLGEIEAGQVKVAVEMGDWVRRHAHALYGTRGGPWAPTRHFASTRTKDAVYLHLMPSSGGVARLGAIPLAVRSARLADGSPAEVRQTAAGVEVKVPVGKFDPLATVVELRLDGDPLTIPVVWPRGETGSLAYRRPVTTSSTITPGFQHDGAAALDDNDGTCWITGRDPVTSEGAAGRRFEHFQFMPKADIWLKSAWIEVDLGEVKTVRRAVMAERNAPIINTFVNAWTLEVEKDGAWAEAASGSAIGAKREVVLEKPVTGRKFRLRVSGEGRIALSELRLFEDVPTPAPKAAVEAWKDLRFGMFIHWGPVALTGKEIGWARGKEVPVEEYDALYKRFEASKFDARKWVAVAKAAGMKYVVLTTRHHDGFSLWDTKHSEYNVMKSPLGRDVVGELAAACKEAGLKFGTYYSTCDWWHPAFPLGSPGGSTVKPHHDLDAYQKYVEAQTAELVTKYGPLLTMWFDVPQEFSERRGQEMIEKLRRLQGDIVINNRTGAPGDFDTPEQRVGGYQDHRPWESCITIGDQWAWKPNERLKSPGRCLTTLLRTIGGDGNLLLNVGPDADGVIEPEQAARLAEVGEWLATHGEAVYGTRGGPWKPTSTVVSTRRGNVVYLHVTDWRGADTVSVTALPRKVLRASVLGVGAATVEARGDDWVVGVPAGARNALATVIKLELDGSAMDLAAMTLPKAAITARASNVYQGQVDRHGPDKAVDGSDHTRWATDDWAQNVWLEVEFAAPVTARRAVLREYGDRIRRYEVRYFDAGEWKTAAAGERVGWMVDPSFPAVTAKLWRLEVLESTAGPSLYEFALEAE